MQPKSLGVTGPRAKPSAAAAGARGSRPEGNIVEERTQVAVVSDKDKLTQIGVSVFGTLEAEGIKVCKDKLYLGYTARGITADNTKHYQNIFVFNPSSK